MATPKKSYVPPSKQPALRPNSLVSAAPASRSPLPNSVQIALAQKQALGIPQANKGAAPPNPSESLVVETTTQGDLGLAAPETRAIRIGEAMAAGKPSKEIADLFVAATSAADFIAIQRHLEMPKVLTYLEDWDAVRVGALGPVIEGQNILNQKRAEYILRATHDYGVSIAEVFVLYMFQSMFGDDMKAVLQILAADRHLGATVGQMREVEDVIVDRGVAILPVDRDPKATDFLVGIAGFVADALSSSELANFGKSLRFNGEVGSLPKPYQDVARKVEEASFEQAMTPGDLALGIFDQLTFGVPLGLYGGVTAMFKIPDYVLTGDLDAAGREFVAAAMLLLNVLGMVRGAKVKGPQGPSQFSMPSFKGPINKLQARVAAILRLSGAEPAALDRLVAQLGEEGMIRAAKYIQADSQVALFAYQTGEAGVIALAKAGGDLARAKAMLSNRGPVVEAARPPPRGLPEAQVTKAPASEPQTRLTRTQDSGPKVTPRAVAEKTSALSISEEIDATPASLGDLEDTPSRPVSLSSPEAQIPESYHELIAKVRAVDLTPLECNKAERARYDAYWLAYDAKKRKNGNRQRLFWNKDDYVKWKFGKQEKIFPADLLRRLAKFDASLRSGAIFGAVGHVAERVWEITLMTRSNTETFPASFTDPITGAKIKVNVMPDFMPTAELREGWFVTAKYAKDAMVIADSKFKWFEEPVRFDGRNQIKGMLALAKDVKRPFVFLVKQGGDVAPAIREWATAFGMSEGVDWFVVTDGTGMIK